MRRTKTGSATRDRECEEAAWTATYGPYGNELHNPPWLLAGTERGGVYVGGNSPGAYLRRFSPTGAEDWTYHFNEGADLQALASDEEGHVTWC